jgi:hypothetical protein
MNKSPVDKASYYEENHTTHIGTAQSINYRTSNFVKNISKYISNKCSS